MMKLKHLFKNIPVHHIKGSKEILITGISINSKVVSPGHLFIAKKGKNDDGSHYIPEAIAAGASAILTDIYDPSFKNIVQIIHPNLREIEASVASEFYQQPSDDLFLVGITGTNGKTTTSFLVKYLESFSGSCGLIGTIEYIIGSYRYQAPLTTPDLISNYKLLREMVNQGCTSAVMEVSSHALDQGRVEKIDYDVAIFSNLTLDHLDYHGTMENYGQAKNKLFRSLAETHGKKQKKRTGIVNADSPWSSKIIEGCPVPILTYGIENNADLKASQIELGSHGTSLQITYQGKTIPFKWPLIGRFNIYNCLSAISVALTKGHSLEEISQKMESAPFVCGRLQAVPNDLNLKIYVDFAHSDDSLLNVLEILNELKTGRIITVFGCGGNRDRSKRPKMAAAAEKYSDIVIITSDNPRSEDPEAICKEIASGFSNKQSYQIELDRRLAIKRAIELASKEDLILIAGKGHETYQIFAHKTIEFNDTVVASEICKGLQAQQL